MKSTGLRIHGKKDLRIDTFDLPDLKDDEILATVVSDTMCMSSWKLAMEGEDHKKTPDDLENNPAMVGHEFSGKILKVGKKWQDKYHAGQNYVIQPNLAREDSPFVPGYSYPYIGGDATKIIIPNEVMAMNCLIPFEGEAYYEGSLCEPVSCVIAAFRAQYHVNKHTYQPTMGIKDGGNLLIVGGTGPMGLLAVDYALHGPKKPKKLVVTDMDQAKLDRAKKLYPSDEVEVEFLNVKGLSNEEQKNKLKELAGNTGFDDIFLMISVAPLVTMADSLLNPDGCLNQFAGPMKKDFSAEINFYNVHYNFTHIVGTSGGDAENEAEAAQLIADKKLDVSKVITHVMGLDAAGETTMDQPEIGGGKKLVYSSKKFDRIELAKVDSKSELGQILEKHDGLWSKEAEDWILQNKPDYE
ncbi:L-sorbose-1-phosphate reductase [Agrilactobacillus composti DSM 18527 = JCM 14202]|uniref:L-sorbose-1-phosphate reductase n=1 Tax=Agrilactobacillus composti DSM 18527 = JCM 14202 TaxID=1423734 RepID=X0QQY9_9LACO|nr:zinc-binding dehydrogenase [Agrilactobacillus composti]KRM35487.1 L-sorbose-1-phosphate reductase [Agrilactobacillus composti DSM 18527 = JCM 14202]GAF41015.1 L-sorbose 1-phosphate reductase [Agrilactobacillus composti DSM 18527 = JCM 14202]